MSAINATQKQKFSRWMPPLAEPTSTLGERILLWYFGVALVILLSPYLLVKVILDKLFPGEDYLSRLAAERAGENIGTFARAFDRRAEPFDPWVIRATWDSFGGVPIRPSDDLAQEFGIAEELDVIVSDIAARSGHSLDFAEPNRVVAEIKTVGDLVRFVTRQPKRVR